MRLIDYLDDMSCRIANKIGLRHTHFTKKELVLRKLRRVVGYNYINQYLYPDRFVQGHVIWVIWAQGQENMPMIVQRCFESIIRNRGTYQVILLNNENIKEFVNLPDFIYKKHEDGIISYAHFSDIIRFTLLSRYGGYYLDATIYLTHPLPIRDRLYTIKQNYSEDYISYCQWTSFFWYVPKGHPLARFLSDYLISYWNKNDTIIDYFLLDYLIRIFYEKNIDFRKEIDSINCNNPDLYFFQSSECENVFDSDKWDNICMSTSIFKLNWKRSSICETEGHDTFYGMLIKGLLVYE